MHRVRWPVVAGVCLAASAQPSAPVAALDPQKSITRYAHQVWKTDAGLPQNSVQSTLQTRDGYLWLGTERGLVRFDGVRFTVFDKGNTPGLQNSNVQVLFQDRDGGLSSEPGLGSVGGLGSTVG
jgi:ligand-binding sensor domain-containing protein